MDVYEMCIDSPESVESSNISERETTLPPISQLTKQQRIRHKYQLQYQLQHQFLKQENPPQIQASDSPRLEPEQDNTPINNDPPNELFKQLTEGCTMIYQQIGKYRDAPLRESERNQIIDHVYSTAKNMLKLLDDLTEDTTEPPINSSSEEYKMIRQARNLQKNAQPKYRRRSRNTMVGHRCHSCNTTETPEWRRGPDGARTLCNACGLHYAKLVKKGSLTVQTHNYMLEAPPPPPPPGSDRQIQFPIIQINNDNSTFSRIVEMDDNKES